jgi:iodothyronine deiodinase-like protein
LDTGSITCPMYANSKTPMNRLQEEYPNIHFLLLYVREAHPGGRTKNLTSMAEKVSNARSMLKLYHEKRKILVDTLDGNTHSLYGSMPNMTYVIGTDGIVKFRANWTNIEALKKVLQNIDNVETTDKYKVVKPPLYIAFRTLLIGGVRALYEFLIGLPQLMRQHKEAGS